MLQSHPDVVMKGEIFRELQGRNEKDIFQEFFSKGTSRTRAMGFKLFFEHPFDKPESSVWEYILSPDVKIILLRRKNAIRNYVSYQIALKTGQWLTRNSGEIMPLEERRLVVNVDDMLAFFAKRERQVEDARQLYHGDRLLEVCYEDFISDHSVVQSVLQFLGVRNRTLRAALKKQNTEHLPDIIENYSEVVARLAGSPYERFLYEADPENVVTKEKQNRTWMTLKKSKRSLVLRVSSSRIVVYLIYHLALKQANSRFVNFRNRLKAHLGNPQQQAALTIHYAERGKVIPSKKWFQRLEQHHSGTFICLRAKSRYLEAQGLTDEAATLWQEEVHLHPGDEDYILEYAHFLQRQHQPERAWPWLENLLHKQPNPKVAITAARCLNSMGAPDRVEVVLARARVEKPSHIQLLQAHVQALIGLGRVSDALGECDRFIQSNKGKLTGYILFARTSILAKDFVGAREALKMAQHRFPNNLMVALMWFHYHLKNDDPQKAEKYLKKGFRLFGKDPKLHRSKMRFLLAASNFQEAEKVIDILLKESSDKDLLLNKARCIISNGELERAKAFLTQLAELAEVTSDSLFFKFCSKAFEDAEANEITALCKALVQHENEKDIIRHLRQIDENVLHVFGRQFIRILKAERDISPSLSIELDIMDLRFRLWGLLPEETGDALAVFQNQVKEFFAERELAEASVPLEINPSKAVGLALEIIQAYKQSRPYAMIFPDQSYSAMLEENMATVSQVAFGANGSRGMVSPADLCSMTTIGLSSADRVGLSDINFGVFSSQASPPDLEVRKAIREKTSTGQHINANAHLALNSWGLYDFIFSFVRSCVVVSSVENVSQVLWRRFGLHVEKDFMVPFPHWQLGGLKDEEAPEDQTYEAMALQLSQTDLRGKLVILDAGVWTVYYSSLVKEKGGVALDLSGVFRQWQYVQTEMPEDNHLPLSYLKGLLPGQGSLDFFERLIDRLAVNIQSAPPRHFWINLSHAEKRRAEMLALFEEHDIPNERVEAFTPATMPLIIENESYKISQGEYACLSSHFKAMIQGARTEKIFIIQEDDLRILQPLDLSKIIATAPLDWEVLQLHVANQTVVKSLFDQFLRGTLWAPWREKSLSAMIYVIAAEAAQRLVEKFYDPHRQIIDLSELDYVPVLDRLVYRETKCYTLTFPIFNPAADGSQLHSEHMRYQRVSMEMCEVARILSHGENPRLDIWKSTFVEELSAPRA